MASTRTVADVFEELDLLEFLDAFTAEGFKYESELRAMSKDEARVCAAELGLKRGHAIRLSLWIDTPASTLAGTLEDAALLTPRGVPRSTSALGSELQRAAAEGSFTDDEGSCFPRPTPFPRQWRAQHRRLFPMQLRLMFP